jgi:hypothetical protein
MVEDEMARDIPHAVPAYQVLGDNEVRDIDRVRQPPHPIGAPPYPYYMYDFWPAWAWGWTAAREPDTCAPTAS